MELDINQIHQFFVNYQTTPMPRVVKGLVLNIGITLRDNDLEASVMEWRTLRTFGPDIAPKIDVRQEGTQIPVLRNTKTGEYSVYKPTTGEYLGQFRIPIF